MMSIGERIEELRRQVPAGVRLVAVSKTHPAEAVREAMAAGQAVFGENRPQEMAAKHTAIPEGVEWHMIGHLQRNKVRMIMPFVSMVESVDSARLLDTIEAEAARIGRRVDVLLEVRIADEDTKSGWEEGELRMWLDQGLWREYTHVVFRGVMGVATNTDDRRKVRAEFIRLRAIFESLGKEYFGAGFDTLSMGMTSDWRLAVECGSTMVRIGSLIFGDREYK